jgi:peptidoglycan/LPS O-acetylase OafA/YrhL
MAVAGAASTVGPADGGRYPVLDGLRALSICLVLAAHLLPLAYKPLQLNAMAGTMGMSLFFALSGFLIVTTLRGLSVRDFLVRRLARLVPMAWLYLAVVWLLHPLPTEGLLAGLLFHLNYKPDLMLRETEHLWSLGVEMHFYLAIAMLALVHRKAVLLVFPLCLIVTGLRIAEGAYLSIATHLRVDEILVGACVAMLPARCLRPWSSGWPVGLWLLAAIGWALTSHPEGGFLQFLRPYATALLLAASLWLADGRLSRSLAAPLPRYVASISYALYVIHPLTAHGWWSEGSHLERYLLKRPLGLAITLLLAHLSTRYWERFWIDWARQSQRKPDASPRPLNAALRNGHSGGGAAAARPSARRQAAD